MMLPRVSKSGTAVLAATVLATLWTSVLAGGDQAVQGTAITVELRNASGRSVGNITAEELLITSDGRTLDILELRPASLATEPWQIVIYFDPHVSSSRSFSGCWRRWPTRRAS